MINDTFSQKQEIIFTSFKISEIFLPKYNDRLN